MSIQLNSGQDRQTPNHGTVSDHTQTGSYYPAGFPEKNKIKQRIRQTPKHKINLEHNIIKLIQNRVNVNTE